MKYMGSKRAMLRNGLGELLEAEIPETQRFVDLFTGSAVVARYAATRHAVEVKAVDLQEYGRILAGAVINRTVAIDSKPILETWTREARSVVEGRRQPPRIKRIGKSAVQEARDWCATSRHFITRAYGGHYFSPAQAMWLDALFTTRPKNAHATEVALASLIEVAAGCAASPGHTAQPFQPTRTALPYIEEAWSRDISSKLAEVFGSFSEIHARVRGTAVVGDAVVHSRHLREGDLVFIDPPYSGVHYSRFYHVLESLARGSAGRVEGRGRYPASSLRPHSEFSVKTMAKDAFEKMLKNVSRQKARAIVTFPAHSCSNGLSGNEVLKIAKTYFHVQRKSVSSQFSTLGGRSGNGKTTADRAARKPTRELILLLEPKSGASHKS